MWKELSISSIVYSDVSMLLVAPSWLCWPWKSWITSLDPSNLKSHQEGQIHWVLLGRSLVTASLGGGWKPVETTGWWKLWPLQKPSWSTTFLFLVEMNGAHETSLYKMISGSMEMALVHCICTCFFGAPWVLWGGSDSFRCFLCRMPVFSNQQGSLLRELDAGWWHWQVTRDVLMDWYLRVGLEASFPQAQLLYDLQSHESWVISYSICSHELMRNLGWDFTLWAGRVDLFVPALLQMWPGIVRFWNRWLHSS